MRRLALGLAVVAFVCLGIRLHAVDIQDCYNGSSEQGGNRVTVNGIQTNQYVQQSYPGTTVEVFLHGTTTHPPAIWQDGAATVPLANPFTSTAHGVAFFCAPDGHYDVKYSGTTITVPFTVSDIHLCFSCGGGGGSVGPGTINQVAKFTSANNVGDSSGGPDDGVNVVPWTHGLSVNRAGYAKQAPNGANCTTQNLLVEYDGSTVGGLGSVQTAALSSQHVIGVAGQGAGCTGSVQITDHGFGSCIFDNQTVIHDAVIASTTVAGQCSDAGATVQGTQVIGRVASLNTGVGTIAVVDWFTGDTFGASGSITACATGGGANAYFPGIGQIVSCDGFILDDGNGGLTFNNPAYAGFSYKKQGPLPPATPANTIMEASPTSVTTQTVIRAGATATAGQTQVVDTIGTDANGNPIYNMKWGSAGGTELQVSGVDNANCSSGVCPLLNLVPGSNCTITNTSGGNVTINCSGSGLVAASNPSAPTVTPTGVTGATSYTYDVYGCEDQSCTKTSAQSATGSTSTGNATLTTSNYNKLTGYADTLYGYRYFVIRRRTGGATQGVIAIGAGKQFNDTGLAGDGTSTTITNTTGLDQHCVGASLPLAVNVIPGAPCGVDAPPTTVAAFDDEFSWGPPGSWLPGDNNDPQWQKLNWGTSTATLTSGHLVLTPQNTGGNDFRMLGTNRTMPSPTWEFELKFAPHFFGPASGSVQSGMCMYDGTKAIVFGIDSRYTQGMFVYNLTNLATFGSTALNVPGNATNTVINNYPNWLYLKIKNDGVNYTYTWSLDGVDFTTLGTTAIGAFLGTPTSIGPCQLTTVAGSSMSIDFFRETL